MNINQIDKKTAQSFYAIYEHLGNCGLGVWHYGIYKDNNLMSVISYGNLCFNANRSFLGQIAQKQNLKLLQLTRGGTKFDADINIPSQAIALSLSSIKRRFGNSLIIAYSDTRWHEMGTIYQASNFLYLGTTNPKGQSNYVINGRRMSGWMVRKRFGTRNIEKIKLLGYAVDKQLLNKKHIYVYINTTPLKRRFTLKELSKMIKAYPKRADCSIGSMIEIQKLIQKQN